LSVTTAASIQFDTRYRLEVKYKNKTEIVRKGRRTGSPNKPLSRTLYFSWKSALHALFVDNNYTNDVIEIFSRFMLLFL
jgi:hypothetical protein